MRLCELSRSWRADRHLLFAVGWPPGCDPPTHLPSIGESWSYAQSRAFAELLIDCEEDRTLRAVLVGMLRETDR